MHVSYIHYFVIGEYKKKNHVGLVLPNRSQLAEGTTTTDPKHLLTLYPLVCGSASFYNAYHDYSSFHKR